MQEPNRVAAAPFRSHLIHECAIAGVSWSVAALHAGLPIPLVHQLLDVRPGRRVERIAPELAERVLGVNAPSLRSLAVSHVPASAARTTLTRLVRAGWAPFDVARRLHLAVGEVDAIASGAASRVTKLIDLRLTALLATASPPSTQRRRATRRAA